MGLTCFIFRFLRRPRGERGDLPLFGNGAGAASGLVAMIFSRRSAADAAELTSSSRFVWISTWPGSEQGLLR